MTVLVVFAAIFCLAALISLSQNRSVRVSEQSLPFKNLPEAFSGFRIVQLSDLHGRHPKGLIERIKELEPDVIVCTGDLYDGVHGQKITDQVLDALPGIAPTYFVSGNHEYYAGSWPERIQNLEKRDIHVLNNACTTLMRNGESLELCGVDDPDQNHHWNYARRLKQFEKNLSMLPKKEAFRILLSHRADLAEQSAAANADLILSGHIHGGQWRFFHQGLIGPYNGDHLLILPKYDAGLFEVNGSKLYVSRGLGDRMAVPRLFNPPELVCLNLEKAD